MKKRKNSIFDTVQMKRPASASFDLSHDVKMSLDMGSLVPSLVMDVLPGDKISLTAENMLRFAPLVSPVMHRIAVKVDYFFVPYRLLWPNWESWITLDTDNEAPYVTGLHTGWTEGCLADYLGIPASSSDYSTQKVSPLHVAAYYKIYDEWYRDQNMITEKFIELQDGDNTGPIKSYFTDPPLKKAWEHDYFTSCLPWPQKGDEVLIPLLNSGTADVQYKSGLTSSDLQILRDPFNDGTFSNREVASQSTGGVLGSNPPGVNAPAGVTARIDLGDTHEVDLIDDAASINTDRKSVV